MPSDISFLFSFCIFPTCSFVYFLFSVLRRRTDVTPKMINMISAARLMPIYTYSIGESPVLGCVLGAEEDPEELDPEGVVCCCSAFTGFWMRFSLYTVPFPTCTVAVSPPFTTFPGPCFVFNAPSLTLTVTVTAPVLPASTFSQSRPLPHSPVYHHCLP